MTVPFNELSPAEAERLALLLEELGEVQQIIGKVLRHGYESRHPDGGPTNRELLERELGDVQSAVDLMGAADDLSPSAILAARFEKTDRVHRYLHHQNDLI
jgi:hypothetical protein